MDSLLSSVLPAVKFLIIQTEPCIGGKDLQQQKKLCIKINDLRRLKIQISNFLIKVDCNELDSEKVSYRTKISAIFVK